MGKFGTALLFYWIACVLFVAKLNYDTPPRGVIFRNGGWIMIALAPILVPYALIGGALSYSKAKLQRK